MDPVISRPSLKGSLRVNKDVLSFLVLPLIEGASLNGVSGAADVPPVGGNGIRRVVDE